MNPITIISIATLIVVMTIIQHHYLATPTQHKHKYRIFGCLRTRNAAHHLTELIGYNWYHGMDGIRIIDDSDDDNKQFTIAIANKFAEAGLDVQYVHIGHVTDRSEGKPILECYDANARDAEFIFAMDDDEYFVPIADRTIYSTLKALSEANCMPFPILFFGTNGHETPQESTIASYTKRERDVAVDKIPDPKVPRLFWGYFRGGSKRRKREQKAMFRMECPECPGGLLTNTFHRRRVGSLVIHGRYGVSKLKIKCDIPPGETTMFVAHYSRSMQELDERINNSWKNFKFIQNRFSKAKSVERYKQERNRNRIVDMNAHKFHERVQAFLSEKLL